MMCDVFAIRGRLLFSDHGRRITRDLRLLGTTASVGRAGQSLKASPATPALVAGRIEYRRSDLPGLVEWLYIATDHKYNRF